MINEMYVATRSRPEPPSAGSLEFNSGPSVLNGRRQTNVSNREINNRGRPCECPSHMQPPPTNLESPPATSGGEWMPKVMELVNTVVDKLLGAINQLTEKLAAMPAANPAPSSTAVPNTTSPQAGTGATTATPTAAPSTAATATSPSPAATTSTETAANGAKTSPLKKSGEFLWKPVSEKDGKLAILLPPNLTGKVARVKILDKDGTTLLGAGRYSGVGNGEREHFRFNKPGSKYPAGSIVDIVLKDGSHRRVTIEKPAERVTR